jgi:hypothetical protein
MERCRGFNYKIGEAVTPLLIHQEKGIQKGYFRESKRGRSLKYKD